VIEPAPVRAGSYFSEEDVRRARAFRRPQVAVHLARMALDTAVLGALVRRPPRVLHGPFRRPLVAAAVSGCALATLVRAAGLPLDALARRRGRRVGLVTGSWGGWAGDVARSTAIGGALAGTGAALGLALVRRSPGRWWVPGSAAMVASATLSAYVAPVLLDPVFNRFVPLAPGPLRDDVLALARRAGVDVGQVLRMDASRRTTAVNAYVTGLGRTKRVVLYDTLLDGFPPEEVRSVVAHELAHVHHRDVGRSLVFLAVVAPAALRAAARVADRLAPPEDRPGPVALPALTLATGAVASLVGIVANQLSRRVEARADAYALRLTGDPDAFIGFERRIVTRNVADPAPSRVVSFLLASHPRAVERIGTAVAYRAGAR
jgi:STE24 endopeptidase